MGRVANKNKTKDGTRAKVTDFKPARKKKVELDEQAKKRVFSVPAHVSEIRTPGGCRFKG